MNDEPAGSVPPPAHASRGRRYRRHELQLADGGRLVLRGDGTIAQLAADGDTTRSWSPNDPAWPDQAIRFGLRPQPPTIPPTGRVQATRPPQG